MKSLSFSMAYGQEFVCLLIALGFFGLDEVAEILESPFGNDPNDIDLMSYATDLVADLELMHLLWGRSTSQNPSSYHCFYLGRSIL